MQLLLFNLNLFQNIIIYFCIKYLIYTFKLNTFYRKMIILLWSISPHVVTRLLPVYSLLWLWKVGEELGKEGILDAFKNNRKHSAYKIEIIAWTLSLLNLLIEFMSLESHDKSITFSHILNFIESIPVFLKSKLCQDYHYCCYFEISFVFPFHPKIQ